MWDQGTPSLSILRPLEVDVPWDDLDSSASGLKTKSSEVEASMSDVETTWGGLQSAYWHPASHDTVWSAMDEVPGLVHDWADTLDSTGTILQDFVTEGRPLQQTSQTLNNDAWILEGRLALSRIGFGPDETDEDSQLRQDIAQHNQDVLNFNSDWRSLEGRIVARLEGLYGSSGVNEDIPEVYADGNVTHSSPAGGFADSFDLGQVAVAAETTGEEPPDVDEILEEVEEVHDGDWAAWAQRNPDVAEELVQQELSGPEDLPEGAEDLYELSEADNTNPENIDAIEETWGELDEAEQQALLMMFPTVFGNMNGIPFAQRGKANEVRVYGEIENQQRILDEQSDTDASGGNPNPNIPRIEGRLEGLKEMRDHIESAQEHAENSEDYTEGDKPFTVLEIGLDDNGQAVALFGDLDENLENLHVNVPGSERDLQTFEDGVERTGAAVGENLEHGYPPDGQAAIYWQGMDTPEAVLDNASDDPELTQMSEEGAEALAAFDYALEKEIEYDDTYVSYDAHSFGANVLGTAAAEAAVGEGEHAHGVQADSMVIADPVGFGSSLNDRSDLANTDADIYWIETRSDIAQRARDAGLMGYTDHLEGSFEEHMIDDLGAVRLESGTAPHPEGEGETVMLEDFEDGLVEENLTRGHGSYFVYDSHSLMALQAVAQGEGAMAPQYMTDDMINDHIEIGYEEEDAGQFNSGFKTVYHVEMPSGDWQTFDNYAEAQAVVIDNYVPMEPIGSQS